MKKILSIVCAAMMASMMWAGTPDYQEMSVGDARNCPAGTYVQVSGQVVMMIGGTVFQLNGEGRAIECHADASCDAKVGDMVTVRGSVIDTEMYGRPYTALHMDEMEVTQTGLNPIATAITIDDLNHDQVGYFGLFVELSDCHYDGTIYGSDLIRIWQYQDSYGFVCSEFVDNPSTTELYHMKGIIDLYPDNQFYLLTKKSWIRLESEPDALDDVTMDAKAQKTLRNGKLVITVGEHEYDAQGAAL